MTTNNYISTEFNYFLNNIFLIITWFTVVFGSVMKMNQNNINIFFSCFSNVAFDQFLINQVDHKIFSLWNWYSVCVFTVSKECNFN